MPFRFLHTADLHLGKTYRTSSGAGERSDDFFRALGDMVAVAIREKVDCLLIAGDLFHTGQILPRTFARTIETLQPLKDAGIPCVAVEGNHDWIHRRDAISWMEALSQMGYLRLLRPGRTEAGGYRFDPWDSATGSGGRTEINGYTVYGLGYIGALAGSHVPLICEAVTPGNNILLFHVGIWSYSPVEIGTMKPEEALPLSDRFGYVALGHGHKPYIVATPDGRPYAFNPGSPECVNFGEERYDKGYYLVEADSGVFRHEFRPTQPRPMHSVVADLDGVSTVDEALVRFRERLAGFAPADGRDRQPLLEIRLVGRVRFHPFELGRERLRNMVEEVCSPLHLEIRNHLSLVTRSRGEEAVTRSLAEIEQEVLQELVTGRGGFRGREDELVRLALSLRDGVVRSGLEGEDLLGLLGGW